jgi:hypothetical protein
MYVSLIDAFLRKSKFLTACTDVTFFKEIALAILSDENPYPYIKLSFMNEKWPFNVLLNNEAS